MGIIYMTSYLHVYDTRPQTYIDFLSLQPLRTRSLLSTNRFVYSTLEGRVSRVIARGADVLGAPPEFWCIIENINTIINIFDNLYYLHSQAQDDILMKKSKREMERINHRSSLAALIYARP